MSAKLIDDRDRRPTRSISYIATTVRATLTTAMPTRARIAEDAKDKPVNWKVAPVRALFKAALA